MKRRRKYTAPLLLVVSMLLIAGCSWFSSSEPTPPGPPAPDYPEDPADYAFYYDFDELELGDVPSDLDLILNNPGGARGDIKIVADSETDSGKALHLKTYVLADTPSMGVTFPIWDIASEDVEVIAFEYKLKYVSGSQGMYLYINETGSDHRIILRPLADGQLSWHASLDGFTGTTVNAIEPGWNTIRVVADRTTRSGDLYVNDMESPIATSLPFQREVPTWEELKFIVVHEPHAAETREAYYADFKVWAVEQEED